MEQPNWWLLPLVSFIPLIIGAIWYNPAVFGKAWMNVAGLSEEDAKSAGTPKTYLLTFLYSLFAAYLITMFAVHQTSIFQLFMGDPAMGDSSSTISVAVNEFMSEYGHRHRSFGHGVIHGFELALLSGLIFLGVPSLFEGKPFKYTMIHTGFWMVCAMIMGGILCAYF